MESFRSSYNIPCRMRIDGQPERVFTRDEVAERMRSVENEQLSARLIESNKRDEAINRHRSDKNGLAQATAALGIVINEQNKELAKLRSALYEESQRIESYSIRMINAERELQAGKKSMESMVKMSEAQANHIAELREQLRTEREDKAEIIVQRNDARKALAAALKQKSSRKPAKKGHR